MAACHCYAIHEEEDDGLTLCERPHPLLNVFSLMCLLPSNCCCGDFLCNIIDMFVVFLHVEILFSYLTLMTRLGILSWHMCAVTWQQVFVPH
jgi:hypothetical protein